MLKVHHSNNFRDTSFYGHEDIITEKAILKMFDNGEYDHVANVNCYSKNEAYKLTNHITKNWTENERVEALKEKVRSTSIGDIIEFPDGELFIVASFGFNKVRAA